MSVTGSASSTDNLKVLKGKIASLSPYAVDPTLSVEGSAADAKAVGDALDKKINHTSIADNLNTNDSDMVLSAKQGTVLKKSVDDLIVNTEESIGNIEQTLTNQGASVKNAQESADNAVELAEKKIDRDGTSAMEANFDMGSHNIVNLAEPVEETDAANKKFVEDTVKFKTVSATLKATDWYSTTDAAPYSQEIAVEGLADGVKAKVYPVFEGNSEIDNPLMTACSYVNTAIRGDGDIIFTCFNKRPGTDIPIIVELYHGDTNDGECIFMSSPFGALTANNVINNFSTTEPGYVADARAIKELSDQISNTSSRYYPVFFGDKATGGFYFAALPQLPLNKRITLTKVNALGYQDLNLNNFELQYKPAGGQNYIKTASTEWQGYAVHVVLQIE